MYYETRSLEGDEADLHFQDKPAEFVAFAEPLRKWIRGGNRRACRRFPGNTRPQRNCRTCGDLLDELSDVIITAAVTMSCMTGRSDRARAISGLG
jgi:hypothetical protein